MKSVNLNGTLVGDNHPCYIIAEIGGAFSTFEEAKRLIDSSIEIGLNAVKFQTLEAETITTKNNFFNMEATGHISQYEIFKKFQLSKELQKKVVNYANDKGITIFSAPSHMKDLEIMTEMDLPIFKIGSDLSCHVPLLENVAKLNKPIILSTGMCTIEEIRTSVNSILNTGNDQLTILHCVSDYPSKISEVNLNVINTLKEEFDLPIGYSDHCIGSSIALASVTMGANLIEKHFRDINNTPSSDDTHSLVKEEFLELKNTIKLIESAKGDGIKIPTESEKKNLITNRVSIISLTDIQIGDIISANMIDIRRPGSGIEPKFFNEIIGKKVIKSIPKETPLSFDMFEKL
jgi:N,N'-diacetyllegionaminate synthase